MPKDLLLYGYIYAESAMDFFKRIDEISEEEGEETPEINFRINTAGGEVPYLFGMLNKIGEMGIKEAIVDGMAYSCGAYACCLVETVKCVEGSTFLIHRASMWTEKYPEYFSDADKKILDETNKHLRKILKAKVDVSKFEKIAKHTIEEIFSMDGIIDVVLSAKQAVDVGLVSEVVKITASRKKEIAALVETQQDHKFKIAAMKILSKASDEDDNEDEDQPKHKKEKSKAMTIEKIKAEHPELYNQIKADGHKEGVAAERDRASSYLAYSDIDAKKAIEGAKSDKPMSEAIRSEFQVLALSTDRLKKITSDSTTTKVVTEEAPILTESETAKKKELADAQAKINAALGKKPITA